MCRRGLTSPTRSYPGGSDKSRHGNPQLSSELPASAIQRITPSSMGGDRTCLESLPDFSSFGVRIFLRGRFWICRLRLSSRRLLWRMASASVIPLPLHPRKGFLDLADDIELYPLHVAFGHVLQPFGLALSPGRSPCPSENFHAIACRPLFRTDRIRLPVRQPKRAAVPERPPASRAAR